jgi:replication-associated recombination protein RarA
MRRAGYPSYTPLAERMRPQRLEAFHGEAHRVGPEGPLRRRAIRQEGLHSKIL